MRQSIEAIERRRRVLRTILFLIIIGTFPFYCLGFYLWGTSPASRSTAAETITPTWTPIGSDLLRPTNTFEPTITPLFSPTALGPLQPTPPQFLPPVSVASPTPQFFFPTATFVTIPTSTTAPSLTPFPTFTPLPSNTPPPIPTNTPLPTNTEAPTNTPLPPPTDTPPPETTDDSSP